MTLTNQWVLHLLWLISLLAVALIVNGRQKKRALEKFADAELLYRLTGIEQPGKRFLKRLLLLASLALMLLALSGPRWGSHYQEVSQKGVEIMVLVDVSPSMLVEDIEPNRLERARREILDFLRVVQGDRVGLVAFSAAAFVQCPLTLDYGALEMFLGGLQPDLIPVPGTDLGAAIETGLSAFDFQAETDKAMLLITDGEDNEGRGLETARKAAVKGVKIFIFGLGETSGGPVPGREGKGGFKKDREGKLILSKLDEEGLREIASITGGVYARSVAGDLDLDILYFEGIKSRTEDQTLKSGKIKVYEDRFPIFVLTALVLLLLEDLIPERVRLNGEGRSRKGLILHTGFRAFTWLSMLVVIASASKVLAADSPDGLYKQGRFAEAEKEYARLDMNHPKDIRYRYNRGCAAYQNSDYQSARAAFSSSLRRALDDGLRFKTAYNLGNIAYTLGEFESAAANYKQAIRYNPSSENARYNLELALRSLEREKKQSAEEQKSANQQDSGESQSAQRAPRKGKEQEEPDRQASQQNPASQEQSRDQTESPQEELENKEDDLTPSEGKKGEHESPRELSGALEALRVRPGEQNEEQPRGSGKSTIDEKMAEVLLDNIQEDRSRFLLFKVPKEKRRGVQSGKDW